MAKNLINGTNIEVAENGDNITLELTTTGSIGDLTTLDTTDKSSLVDAINELVPTVLYSDETGATDTVTLDDDYTNYTYIEIFGARSNIATSCKIDTSLTSRASLTVSNYASNVITIYTARVILSGTTATMTGGAIAFQSGGIAGFASNNEIYITKIIGYK